MYEYRDDGGHLLFFAQLGLLRGRVLTAGATASALGYIFTTGLPRLATKGGRVETLLYRPGDGCVHHRPSAAACTSWKNFGRGFKEGIPRTASCLRMPMPMSMPMPMPNAQCLHTRFLGPIACLGAGASSIFHPIPVPCMAAHDKQCLDLSYLVLRPSGALDIAFGAQIALYCATHAPHHRPATRRHSETLVNVR